MQKPKSNPLVILFATLTTALVLSLLIIPICFGVAYLLGLLPDFHRETFFFALAWSTVLSVGIAFGQERKK